MSSNLFGLFSKKKEGEAKPSVTPPSPVAPPRPGAPSASPATPSAAAGPPAKPTGGLRAVRPSAIRSGKSTQRIVLPGRGTPAAGAGTSAAAAGSPQNSGSVSLPVGMILRVLPPEVLAMTVQDFEASSDADAETSIPLNLILSQLPSGKIELSVQEIVPYLPKAFLKDASAQAPYLATLVNLPLADIYIRIPPDLLALRPDQKPVDAAVTNMADPFTEEILREQAAAAAKVKAQQQEPPKVEAPQAKIIEESEVPTAEEFVSKAEPVAVPVAVPIPVPPPAALKPVPERAEGAITRKTQPLPTTDSPTPASESTWTQSDEFRRLLLQAEEAVGEPPVAPPEVAAEPVKIETSSEQSSVVPPLVAEKTPELPSVPVAASPLPLPVVPSIPAPPFAQPEPLVSPASLPVPVVPPTPAKPAFTFAASAVPVVTPPAPVAPPKSIPSAIPAESPKVAELLPVLSPPVATVPDKVVTPTPVKEIAPAPVSSASIDLNSCAVEDLLKVAGCPRLLAEAIISYREGKGPFRSIEDLLKVPGMTSTIYVLLTGQEAPVDAFVPSINELLGFPSEQEVTLKDIVDRVSIWPDVAGCVLGQADGLPLVGNVPSGVELRSIIAFCPKIFSALNSSFREFAGVETDEIVLPMKGMSYAFLRSGSLFMVTLSHRRQMPKRHMKILRKLLMQMANRNLK